MPKIEKPHSFFRSYGPHIMGTCYICYGGILYLVEGNMPEFPIILFGFAVIVYGYFSKGHRKEYIKWDSEAITIKDSINGKLVYTWSQVDDILFSENHLTIKSGKANGVMLEFKEYKPEDVLILRNQLKIDSFKIAGT